MEAKQIRDCYNKLKMKSPEWIPEIDHEVFNAGLQAGRQEGSKEVVSEIRGIYNLAGNLKDLEQQLIEYLKEAIKDE